MDALDALNFLGMVERLAGLVATQQDQIDTLAQLHSDMSHLFLEVTKTVGALAADAHRDDLIEDLSGKLEIMSGILSIYKEARRGNRGDH